MKILLKNVIPEPLLNEDLSSSLVWGKEFSIDTAKNYFLSSNSGKGKSTFLHFLYGLRNKYEGSILINNQNIKSYSLNNWASYRKTKVAYLPQDLQLIEQISVWDNLCLKNNLTNHYTPAQIEAFLHRLNISNLKNRMVNTLSLGQQQRVALIRTILQPFEFLLLDEPFSHIDNDNINQALLLINDSCKKEKAGYLIATLGYNYGITTNEMLQI